MFTKLSILSFKNAYVATLVKFVHGRKNTIYYCDFPRIERAKEREFFSQYAGMSMEHFAHIKMGGQKNSILSFMEVPYCGRPREGG